MVLLAGVQEMLALRVQTHEVQLVNSMEIQESKSVQRLMPMTVLATAPQLHCVHHWVQWRIPEVELWHHRFARVHHHATN